MQETNETPVTLHDDIMEQKILEQSYPTKPDSDGFYFEDETDESMQVMTKVYENENAIMKVLLRRGRIAIVRELTGDEILTASKPAGKDQAKVQPAIAAYATKIDDKPLLMEDLLAMKAKDYLKIMYASNALNFI